MRFTNQMEGLIESDNELYRWKFNPNRGYFSVFRLDDSLLFLTKIHFNLPATTALEKFAMAVLGKAE